MSDDGPKDVPPPPGDQHPPNWGSAYPPPPAGQYPPGYGSVHPQGQQPPAYGQPAYPSGPPAHQNATTAMVLGIISLAGLCLCYVTIFLAPFAWYLGARAEREIDANPQAFSGRGQASAGKIMGIIGTILLALSLLAISLLVVLLISSSDFRQGFDDGFDSYLLAGVR